jgi:hypothetical protein
MSEPASKVETIRPIVELFTSSVTALWATTYNIDLALFNEFLLRRLGDAPLNVVVLADQQRLSDSLERISADSAESMASVNRRWLLRGVRVGLGAFHPKTFIAIAGKRVKLLVGSGNLSRNGLDAGNEIFTEFNSGTTIGNAAIATWRTWMRRMIKAIGDTTLASRFQDLEQRFPDAPTLAPDVREPLLHNLDTSIADQFSEGVLREPDERVDELLLSAPFYDVDAKAVEQLIMRLRPRKVSVYITSSTKVKGERLSSVLSSGEAEVDVFGYVPDDFIHAKMVGAAHQGRCWLLTGSANLSRSGLTLNVNTGGNIELGVVAAVTEDEMRSLFVPPDTIAEARSLEDLQSLQPELHREEKKRLRIVLKSASRLSDGTVRVCCEPTRLSDCLLDDRVGSVPLLVESSGDAVTEGPVAGRLVQVVSPTHVPLSNVVVVDDPASLAAILLEKTSSARKDVPQELGPSDVDTLLGSRLVWLNQHLILDVSEQMKPPSIVDSSDTDESDDEFWERLEQEQLARDPRVDRYRIIIRGRLPDTMEPIFELLDMMRDRVIGPQREHIQIGTTTGKDSSGEEGDKPKHKWSTSTRIRVRARNMLHRWAAAQMDPRYSFIDPLAPMVNLAAIAKFLILLWTDEAENPGCVPLIAHDLNDVWHDWLTKFVGSGQGDGWLDRLDDETRARAVELLPVGFPERSAALCWLGVQPGEAYRDRVLAWQQQIAKALDLTIIEPNSDTAKLLSSITHTKISLDKIDDDLLKAVDYIDDDLWQERISGQFGLASIRASAKTLISPLQISQ